MINACFYKPMSFAVTCVCPCFYARSHRITLLDGDMSRYKCCNDRYAMCTRHCDGCVEGNEACCLWCESIFCSECAHYTNRSMIMERFGVRDSACDACIQIFVCFCQIFSCVLRCTGNGSDELDTLVDILYCMVYGCMAAQHAYELDYQLGEGAGGKQPDVMGRMSR